MSCYKIKCMLHEIMLIVIIQVITVQDLNNLVQVKSKTIYNYDGKITLNIIVLEIQFVVCKMFLL